MADTAHSSRARAYVVRGPAERGSTHASRYSFSARRRLREEPGLIAPSATTWTRSGSRAGMDACAPPVWWTTNEWAILASTLLAQGHGYRLLVLRIAERFGAAGDG